MRLTKREVRELKIRHIIRYAFAKYTLEKIDDSTIQIHEVPNWLAKTTDILLFPLTAFLYGCSDALDSIKNSSTFTEIYQVDSKNAFEKTIAEYCLNKLNKGN